MPAGSTPPTKLDEESWRVLRQLIRRYGADEIARSIRLYQMYVILGGDQNPENDDDQENPML